MFAPNKSNLCICCKTGHTVDGITAVLSLPFGCYEHSSVWQDYCDAFGVQPPFTDFSAFLAFNSL